LDRNLFGRGHVYQPGKSKHRFNDATMATLLLQRPVFQPSLGANTIARSDQVRSGLKDHVTMENQNSVVAVFDVVSL